MIESILIQVTAFQKACQTKQNNSIFSIDDFKFLLQIMKLLEIKSISFDQMDPVVELLKEILSTYCKHVSQIKTVEFKF